VAIINNEYKRVADIKRLEFILNELKDHVQPGAAILDIGCGNGIISRNLALNGYNVSGIDVSTTTIENAKKLSAGISNVSFMVKSAEELLADGTKYDAIICSEVLEHLHKPENLVQTLKDILTPNGLLIVTVPNGNGPRELFVTKPVQALRRKNNFAWKILSGIKKLFGYGGTTVQSSAEDLNHIQFFTRKKLEQLSKENNFQIIKFGKSNFIDDVFPFSLIAKRAVFLQKLDSHIADLLPYYCTGGFFSVWKRNET
jgi:2-polyprenyl-3-methyl-5-hydroxy-6-metoxy-1,4-benzoquinol methylase